MTKVFNYMFSKRNLPVVLIFLAAGVFVAFRTLGLGGGNNNETKYDKILHTVGDMLTQIHYSPRKVDDEFSKEVFKKFLGEKIDDQKNILLVSDVNQLKADYETKLDDEIRGGSVQFVPAVSTIFKQRIAETEAIYKDILSKPFDFSKEESVNLNTEKAEYPKNAAERLESWRKRLKYLALDRYAELIADREKNSGKEGYVKKTDAQLEAEARERVLKIMNRTYDRLKFKVSDDDRFNEYVKTVSESMDPHTTFFPPVDKRYFDEQMSGQFFGIGASLREEDGFIKIVTLVAGSPAWKSGVFNVGDIILKVAEGKEGEWVDLTGYIVEDAVKLIRGKKGTEVRLTL